MTKVDDLSIREELAKALDPDHAQAVIDHRKAKRAPLTLRAAEMLVRQFSQWPDPNAAADEMILRGWTGFKSDWSPPPPVPVTVHRERPKCLQDTRPEPPPEVRARNLIALQQLSMELAAQMLMDKPRRVMPRGIR